MPFILLIFGLLLWEPGNALAYPGYPFGPDRYQAASFDEPKPAERGNFTFKAWKIWRGFWGFFQPGHDDFSQVGLINRFQLDCLRRQIKAYVDAVEQDPKAIAAAAKRPGLHLHLNNDRRWFTSPEAKDTFSGIIVNFVAYAPPNGRGSCKVAGPQEIRAALQAEKEDDASPRQRVAFAENRRQLERQLERLEQSGPSPTRSQPAAVIESRVAPKQDRPTGKSSQSSVESSSAR
jgi:hypothetical protein